MPVDAAGYENISFYNNGYLGAQLKFAWLPEKCNISGKRIWLEYAYELIAMRHLNPENPIFEYRWHNKNEHIWLEYAHELTAMCNGTGNPMFEYRWHKKNEHIIWKLTK